MLRRPLEPKGVFGQTCGTCRLHFLSRRATGAASARPSLHPSSVEGDEEQQNSGAMRRGNADACDDRPLCQW